MLIAGRSFKDCARRAISLLIEKLQMANQEHLRIIEQGVDIWNQWREQNPGIKPDLSGANLFGMLLDRANLSNTNLTKANLSNASLSEANLWDAYLTAADLRGAHLFSAQLVNAFLNEADLEEAFLNSADLRCAFLSGANLSRASLQYANLSGADLSNAYLCFAYLSRTNFSYANLNNANLIGAQLMKTDLRYARLSGCLVFGSSAWGLKLEGAEQLDLIITDFKEPTITVDNLEVAQFIYLLLNNKKIRDVIETVSKKVVLILGSFTEERKAVLDALREELRHLNYLPVLFDFDKPTNRDMTETISTLAHISRFVIADITDAKSIPQELLRIVPSLPSVPVQPLLQSSASEFGMFEHFKRFPWVFETYYYDTAANLLTALSEKVIAPAEAMAKKLTEAGG